MNQIQEKQYELDLEEVQEKLGLKGKVTSIHTGRIDPYDGQTNSKNIVTVRVIEKTPL